MANDLVWDKRMLNTFESTACLTEDETIVLHDWVQGKTIVYTSMAHNMSTRKIDKLRNNIRMKYDRVQVYTPELPKRTRL
jgi:hypothetical protein